MNGVEKERVKVTERSINNLQGVKLVPQACSGSKKVRREVGVERRFADFERSEIGPDELAAAGDEGRHVTRSWKAKADTSRA